MNISTKEALDKIGFALKGKFQQFKSDRATLEQQWLKNLRQYMGKYDPEIEQMIPADRSRVYPKDTRIKVTGFTAKMMEMMFPAADMNWDVTPTALPNIPEGELQKLIYELQSAAQGQPITSEQIEEGVKKFAQKRASAMKQECVDQLSNIGGERIEYPQLCKKVIRSGAIYGIGVVEGPQVRQQEERVWTPDPATGTYFAATLIKDTPYYEHVRVWDIYPDLSARGWREQEGIFRRYVFTRHKLRELVDREDFKGDVIKAYLRDNSDGNYTEYTYESDLNNMRHTSNVAKRDKRKYEVVRYYGYMSAKELESAGVPVPDNQLDMDIMADVWLLDDKIIKADEAQFGSNPADIYHAFIYEDDEDSSLTGTALTEVLRDGQMRLCSVDRATQDNMARVAVPIYEVNEDLMARGHDSSGISAGATIYREGRGAEASAPCVRQIAMNSHIPELLNLRQTLTQVMDVESNLPSWMLGNAQPLGEAFRTSNNMSMMQGGANMLTKDIVRSFDRFTASLIGSLVQWNMEFNTKQEIKGDYQVQAKGNISLVAKEVRGAAMDQLLTTLTPEERALIKTRETLLERIKNRDLPTDIVVGEEEAVRILDGMRQAQQQAQQLQDGELRAKTAKLNSAAQKDATTAKILTDQNQAKIAEILARVEATLAQAKGTRDNGQLQHIKLLLETLQQGEGAGTGDAAPQSEQQRNSQITDTTSGPPAGAI